MIENVKINNGMYDSYYKNSSIGVSQEKGKMLTPNEAEVLDKKGVKDPRINSMKRNGQIECQSCKERKYQDGSDENVSFKSPGHISPEASATTVRAHEQEHVANAFTKASNEDGKVVMASVSLKTEICSECGRSYVAGGETTTQIKYSESNPYSQAAKVQDASILIGNNVNDKV